MSNLSNLKNDEAQKYIFTLAQRLERHFDLSYEKTVQNEYFDFYAYHQQNFHKSFITKATVYEGFSVYEHMLLRFTETCDSDVISRFQNMLVKITPTLANPNKLHKRSAITGILLCANDIPEDIGNSAVRFFHRQNYKFCFHGWSETMCAIVSLAAKKVYYPKRNKDLGKLISF